MYKIKVKCYHCGKILTLNFPDKDQFEQLGITSARTLEMLMILDAGWHIALSSRKPIVCPNCWPNVLYSYREFGELKLSDEDNIILNNLKKL